MVKQYRFLSWGKGVQSTTLLAMSALGELEPLDAAVTADTMNERRKTYETQDWYKAWAEDHDVRVEITSAGDILKLGASDHIHIPFWTASGAPMRRQCTRYFKIEPVKRLMRQLAGYDRTKPPHPRPGQFELWLGISWDEAAERVSDSDVQFIQHRYPLVERRMTRNDCIDWLKDHGLPVPVKSACIICPFRTATEWLDMKQSDPNEFSEAVAFDEANRDNPLAARANLSADQLFVWREAIPLKDADLEAAAKRERTAKQLPLMVCTGTYCWT